MSGQLPASRAQRNWDVLERVEVAEASGTVRMIVADNWLHPVVVHDEPAILRAYTAALEASA
ncbi:hypothetical protein [Nocardia blacklockiae]|uniref:hypothetical protein n=1 Tax=Nocardia blacklockiae TaxID=480036 RepID=UPI0018949E49|nr:hypothetical protein [Nocardia blacklockiae]MBF6170224.1 hypothetical protein [Nocardia blacklockiae]